MGHKTFNLMAIQAAYGGWIAELETFSLSLLRFISSLLTVFPPFQHPFRFRKVGGRWKQ
jgi:hypothetical protein